MVEKLQEKSAAFKRAVGRRVRELRLRAGFSSIESAAERMGVHPNSVGDIERGTNFLSPEMAVRMMEAYGLADGGPLLGTAPIPPASPREALSVIAREIEAPREPPGTTLPPIHREVLGVLSALDEPETREVLMFAENFKKLRSEKHRTREPEKLQLPGVKKNPSKP